MALIEPAPAPLESPVRLPFSARDRLAAEPDRRPPETASAFDHDVAIVGLGYVGLPTALAYHHAGRRVLALDVSAARLDVIRAGEADLVDRDHERLDAALADALTEDGAFTLTDDVTRISSAAAVIVCVPTPVDVHLVPDLTVLRGACATVVERATRGQVLMLTSTTYVGCTSDLLVDPLRERGFTPGDDVHVAFSAERIDPGSTAVAQEEVPRVVGGATPACRDRAEAVLSQYAGTVHPVGSLGTAEMTKLLENTFRAVNIALANEFADICRSFDIEVTEVIDAAATKPYGYMPFTPGPGVGGHCIPCDPHYLLWQLKRDRIDAPVISTAMQAIAGRPGRVVDRIRAELAERGVRPTDARVLVAGVAYKPDVADLRESPALEILDRLYALGIEIGYIDPLIPGVLLDGGHPLASIDDPAAFGPTVVLLHTRHRDLDLSWLTADHLIIDATYRAEGLQNAVSL